MHNQRLMASKETSNPNPEGNPAAPDGEDTVYSEACDGFAQRVLDDMIRAAELVANAKDGDLGDGALGSMGWMDRLLDLENQKRAFAVFRAVYRLIEGLREDS